MSCNNNCDLRGEAVNKHEQSKISGYYTKPGFRDMAVKIMMLTLRTFSMTGGLQNMTRTMGYSLQQIARENEMNLRFWSVYDKDTDLMPRYISAENFRGYENNRFAFFTSLIKNALWPDILIISHINLAVAGLLIRSVKPECKIWLIAHGIEVWRPLSGLKKRLLKICDKIICVSHFTRQEILRLHHADPAKCVVLNNALDPFMKLPAEFDKPDHLLKKYGLTRTQPVVFTLSRLSFTEREKGYDLVISAIGNLKDHFPGIRYLLAGKADENEKLRLEQLIKAHNVEENVILTGYINDSELSDHFLLADIFVMPSKKDGFGIVFIEALACGLPVICGNADGSVDAIRNGELGKAIDPGDQAELEKAISEYLSSPLTGEQRKQLQAKCLKYFSERTYQMRLKELILNDR